MKKAKKKVTAVARSKATAPKKVSVPRKAPGKPGVKASLRTVPAKSKLKKVSDKTRAVVDQSLAQLSPALKKKLEMMRNQWTVGDLQVLGYKVFERAREVSNTVRAKAAGSASKRTSKKK